MSDHDQLHFLLVELRLLVDAWRRQAARLSITRDSCPGNFGEQRARQRCAKDLASLVFLAEYDAGLHELSEADAEMLRATKTQTMAKIHAILLPPQ